MQTSLFPMPADVRPFTPSRPCSCGSPHAEVAFCPEGPQIACKGCRAAGAVARHPLPHACRCGAPQGSPGVVLPLGMHLTLYCPACGAYAKHVAKADVEA